MSGPNPQIADDTLPSQNPSLVEDQQCEDQQIPHSDSQSSKTLISDHQDPEKHTEQDAHNPQEVAAPEFENPRDSLAEVQTGTQNVDDVGSTSALSPRNADINVSGSDASSRRGSKRKRMGPKRTAQEKKFREKFSVLVETLKPVPFIPVKTLDFTSHETLLRRLGLWDFVHIEFDRSIRSDLVAQLIAGYTPSSRSSYVNGMRIMVNRADLGRALKLPVKKTVVTDDVLETLDLAESLSFIEEVVSNWMLLHEDTYIMPTEVLTFTKMIKEGHLEKVDWAGLIWQMVEKELKSPQLENCYYASHLQQLIKVQREEFLREEPKVEVEVKDEEEEEEEDDYGGGDPKMSGVEDGGGDLKWGGVEHGGSDPKSGEADHGGSDPKSGGVEHGGSDPKSGGVEDAGSDPKCGGVEDAGSDPKCGGIEDAGDDKKCGGVEDAGGDPKLGGVEDAGSDPKLGGVEDAGGDPKFGGVEDAGGDEKLGGVGDAGSDEKLGGVKDAGSDEKLGSAEDGSGDTKMGGVEDGSGDTKMGGDEDGSDDMKMGVAEDGSGDKMGGAEDGSSDTKMGGAEDGSGDTKMGGVDDGSGDLKMEGVDVCDLRMGGVNSGPNIELSLGQDNAQKVEVEKEQDADGHVMNIEVFKEKEPRQWFWDRKDNSVVMAVDELKEEEPGQWPMDRKNNAGEPFLRQCSFSDANDLNGESKKEEGEGQEGGEDEGEEEEDEEEEAEEDEHEGGFHLSAKCIPLEGMSSGGLMQALETGHMPFNNGIELRDNSIGGFLSSRDDAQMVSGSSLFNNGHKRDIGQDNNNSHHSLNVSNKRLRSDSPWNAKPADFEMCMVEIGRWMEKARALYAEKEHSCEELTSNQQIFLNELQKRSSMIDSLHKANMDDNQKRQMEVYRLEKELYMMSNLLDGYRKALKETQKSFAEYRARCPEADEPLYKDVPGSGGLVLSVMELEKERLKQEEEERMKRLMIEKKLRDFEGGWVTKLEDHLNRIQLLDDRLLAMEDQVKDLNELNAKRKVSDPPECPPSEEQAA